MPAAASVTSECSDRERLGLGPWCLRSLHRAPSLFSSSRPRGVLGGSLAVPCQAFHSVFAPRVYMDQHCRSVTRGIITPGPPGHQALLFGPAAVRGSAPRGLGQASWKRSLGPSVTLLVVLTEVLFHQKEQENKLAEV